MIAIYKATAGASAELDLCRVDVSGIETSPYKISGMSGYGATWIGTPLSSSAAVVQPIG